MKILIAAGIFPPDIGGPATYAELLAGHLVSEHHSVTVFCYGDRSSDDPQSYRIVRFSRKQAKWLLYARYTIRLFLEAMRSDILYAQGPIAGGVQSYVVTRILRKPYVVKITGDYAWEQAQAMRIFDLPIEEFQTTTKRLPFRIRLLRHIQTKVARSAYRVIVPSIYLQRLVAGWNIGAERIAVIYNAAPLLSGTVGSKEESRRLLEISFPLAISVGRLVPWKGFDALITLWPRVLDAIPRAHLWIIGSGPEHAFLTKEIRTLRLEDNVCLLGGKTSAEMHRLYTAADAFVLNSGYEGLSHTILEALVHGLPCAVSDSGGNAEVIEHERSGLLFRYNDHDQIIAGVIKLLTDRQSASTYAKIAEDKAVIFSVPKMLHDTTSLLGSAIKKSPRV